MWLGLMAVGRTMCCHWQWMVSVVSCKACKECEVNIKESCCLCRSSRSPHATSNLCKQKCCRQGEGSSWRNQAWLSYHWSMFPEQSVEHRGSRTGWVGQVERRPGPPSHLGSACWCYGLCRSGTATYWWSEGQTWSSLEVRCLHVVYLHALLLACVHECFCVTCEGAHSLPTSLLTLQSLQLTPLHTHVQSIPILPDCFDLVFLW